MSKHQSKSQNQNVDDDYSTKNFDLFEALEINHSHSRVYPIDISIGNGYRIFCVSSHPQEIISVLPKS